MENYADGVSPTKYAFAAEFELDALDFIYEVDTSAIIDFDRRRHRHLQEEDLSRALAESGLKGAGYSVDMSMLCAPNSACAAIADFFEVNYSF